MDPSVDLDRSGPDPESLNTFAYETERLAVELPDEADTEDLFGLVGGPHRDEICATLAWDGPDDVSDTEWWVEQCCTATYADWGFHWVIRDRAGELTGAGAGGRAIGAIGTRPTGIPGRADVGYWLGRPYWGQGVMTEALTGLVDLGRHSLGYAKMEATVFVTNPAGCRLVERVGFEREGLIRLGHRKRGAWVDTALYGLVLDGAGAGAGGEAGPAPAVG